jgi:hypothetical protein
LRLLRAAVLVLVWCWCGDRQWREGAGERVLEETHDTEELIQRIAALDIGKATLVCCVRVPSPEALGTRLQEVTTYQTMTRSLLALADRLAKLGVTRVVMEATSDYWKPVFYLNCPGFDGGLNGWV